MKGEATPGDLREGVRAGILASIERDVELRGGRTAGRLVFAGVAGVLGAIGVTLLVATHPFGHHPSWHVVVFSTVWAGLLVVAFALALLRLRTPRWPIGQSAAIALFGVGVAGICGALCPDEHFLGWWTRTPVGGAVTHGAGIGVSALCFGTVTTFVVGIVSALFLWRSEEGSSRPNLLTSAMLFVLLLPGVALQSVGMSLGVFFGWAAGTALGALAGIAGGTRLGAGTGRPPAR